MADASFVHDLGIVMAVAAGTGLLCRRFKQPSILGYLAAGLIVGPYIPIPLFADMGRVHSLSEFGVVLVMFAIGLEFQLSRLFKVLPVAGFTGLIQIGTLLWFGFALGLFMGWDTMTSMFLGAGICISSTMLVSKIFEEQEVKEEVRTLVLGVLVLQDVAAIALIATMTAVAESGSVSFSELSITLGRLLFTLVAMTATGLLIVPRLVRHVLSLKNNEAVIVVAGGLCFGFALLAEQLGYSVALGAFVGGLLVAESGHGHDVEHAIKPLKDMFAAIFFVSIGMTVDPTLAMVNIGPALLVFAGVILFQLLSISIAGILSGNGMRVSLTAGLSLGQIGEFGFIIVAIGTAGNVIDPSLQPILVTVAVLTAFTTPIALRKAHGVVSFVDRKLPVRIKHLLAVYEGWFEGIRRQKQPEPKSPTRKAVRALVLDVLAWILLLFLFLYYFDTIVGWLSSRGLPYSTPITYSLLALLSIPPFIGLVRNTNHLEKALLEEEGRQRFRKTHLTKAGEAMMRAAIHTLVMMGAGIPAIAVLFFMDHAMGLELVIAGAIFMTLTFFWKSAGRLESEVRSEAERLVAFLDKQRSEGVTPETETKPFFPNLGTMKAVYIPEGSPVVGKSLTQLNLRALTGALVVAIHREGKDIALPTGSKVIQADDLLFLTGTKAAVTQARQMLET